MKQYARFKRSGLLAKIIIVAALLYVAISLLTLHSQIAGAQAELDSLAAQAEKQRQINAGLESSIEDSSGANQTQEAARDRLGLVLPNEKVIYDISS